MYFDTSLKTCRHFFKQSLKRLFRNILERGKSHQFNTRDHKTEVTYLQELSKRLEDRHVDCSEAVAKKASADATSVATVNPSTPNVLQVMMKIEQVKTRAHEMHLRDQR
jgi:hypothetical protein